VVQIPPPPATSDTTWLPELRASEQRYNTLWTGSQSLHGLVTSVMWHLSRKRADTMTGGTGSTTLVINNYGAGTGSRLTPESRSLIGEFVLPTKRKSCVPGRQASRDNRQRRKDGFMRYAGRRQLIAGSGVDKVVSGKARRYVRCE